MARNTNRELKINSSALDRRISGLPQAGGRALDPDRISDTLAFLVSERIRVSAILANRRIEGTENVVDLIRCFTGNSALRLSGGPVGRAAAGETIPCPYGIMITGLTAAPLMMSSAALLIWSRRYSEMIRSIGRRPWR
jgi:hypothetical protein